jgi:LXG domain of WXG superfamily/A nuclease of the HNH/ENDO VII superfamily with conserved LHH
MKILDVDGFQNGMKEIEETLSSQKDQVQQIERAVQDVVNLDDAFKGEGGNAIRDFYRSHHLPMLEQYQDFLSDYQSVIREMKEALDHVEPSPDGFMRQSFLDNEVEEGLHRARQITVELTGEANATIRSVSDIVSVPRIQDWSFLQQVTHAQEEKERSLQKLHEFDHTQTASLSSLEEQVHSMTQQIARLETVFQKGKLGIIEKKDHQEDSSFLSKLSEFTSVMAKNKLSEFLGTVEGALFAIVDIVSDLVDTLIALFTDPIGFFKGIIHTVLHPIDTAKYIWKDLKQSFEEEVVNGDVRSRARYFSYAGTYIAATIFGTKGVDKVSKMGKVGKMSSKADVPYNVMTTAKIKSFIHDGVKSTFGKVEDTAHQLLSSRTGKRALGLNAFSGHLQELFRKTKNVLNPKKVKSVMEKTYHKVVAGPVSRVAQSETFSRMGKVLLNEDGHVVVSGKDRLNKIDDGGRRTSDIKSSSLKGRSVELDWLGDNYRAIEIEGTVKVGGKEMDISRRVYQINNIDWDYVPNHPTARGLSNKQLTAKGRAPFVVDKTGREVQVELHHLIQKESGNMVEIVATTHDEYKKILHGLIKNGDSFRNNEVLDKQFNNFRKKYWKWRTTNID